MVCSVSNKVQKCIHKWKLSCCAFTVTCGKGLAILFPLMRCSSSEPCFEMWPEGWWHGWRLKFLFVVMWVGLVYGNLSAKVYIAFFLLPLGFSRPCVGFYLQLPASKPLCLYSGFPLSFNILLLSSLPEASEGGTNQISLQNSAITCLFSLYRKERENDENY